MTAKISIKAQVLRCAVYTRKSSEEGLEQSFNSLHAQREACEAFIKSQAGEGWALKPDAYDDGGFSGGTMDRPGLKLLLADIAAGIVDVVVVYKVDRLTRSLTDFARIVDRFDARGVSFVSVTQAFNTTSSMGRLTLNVLLSFAQFEREVTGERIRDKIAASKAKGMWMGGVLPLGYDLDDRCLVVNAAEAEQVSHIFRRYLKLGSVHALRDELERTGVRSKAWTTRDGRPVGGAVICRGALFHMLQNRLYRGQIVHRDLTHPGLHKPIVEAKLFDAVAKRLAGNRTRRRKAPKRSDASLLTGRIYDADGEPMSPSFGYGKSGKLYRYYIAMALQVGRKPAPKPDAIRRIGAEALERFVTEQLRRLADRPELAARDIPALVRRLDVRDNDTQIVLSTAVLFGDDHPQLAFEDLQGRLAPGERAVWEPSGEAIRVALPMRLKLRGGRTWISHGGVVPNRGSCIDLGLVTALRSTHAELATLNASPLTPLSALRDAAPPDGAHRRQLSRLAFLAPDLQQMILDGRQPARLKLRTLLKSELPLAWADQRDWLRALARQGPRPG